MATTTATLAVKVTADASQAARELDQVGSAGSKFQSGLNKASVAAAAGGAALVAFGKQAFDAASSAQQASGAVDAAFGGSADAIHKFAQTSAESVGLASGDYEAMAATFGAQLKNMGVAADDLAPTTNDLVSLGADLAAQFGGSTSDAVAALGSLLRGETDPIERYGVAIKSADVEAKKAEMGLAGLTGAADKQATTQATLALLTEQTASATGAFAREADTAAGQQQRASAAFKDASAAIGEALLPVVGELAKWLGKLAGFVKQNKSAFTAFGAVLAGIAATVLTVKAATMAWQVAQTVAKVATTAWTAAQWLLNAAMTANPIGIVVVAIGALVAAIVVLVKNWDTVTAALKATWSWIKQNWPLLLVILTGPFGLAVAAIIKHRDKILDVLRRVLEVAKNVAAAVRNVLVAAFRFVRDVAAAVLAAIRTAINTTIGVVRRIADVVRTALGGAWRTLREIAATVLGAIRTAIGTTIDKVRNLITWVKDTLGAAWRAVKDTARTMLGLIRDGINWPLDKLKTLVSYITGTVKPVWDKIASAAGTALGIVEDAVNGVKDALGWLIDKVESVINAIGRIKFPSPPSWLNPFTWLPNMAPAPSPARFAAPTVGARTLGTRASSSSGGQIVINVSGALDPDAVARQIDRILTARARRVGGVRRAGAA